ncbi:MAG: AAA family ATPase [Endomicrobium sp.]|nr:AAA family ATPase [Endomicrobium sp.]
MPIQLLFTLLCSTVSSIIFVLIVYKKNITNSNFKKLNSDYKKVFFSDIIGLTMAKKEILETINSIKYTKNNIEIYKGILLMGPPGCGKTLIAKAIATECNLPFISVSGSDFVEMFIGVGASRIRSLFKKAREYAYFNNKACIIFIDEIETIGRKRVIFNRYISEEINGTQNQLLVEMDGIKNINNNIFVIAATNVDEKNLDTALLRAGRFDKKINIGLPNSDERKELFKFYLNRVKNINIDSKMEFNINELVKRTIYKSPADIKNIITEAVLIAKRKKNNVIEIADLFKAIERINFGIETNLNLSNEEIERLAYHESGHAIALYLVHPNKELLKITLKTYGTSLGHVFFSYKRELHSKCKKELVADIMFSLAGYVAEKIKYNTTSTGVVEDLECAMSIANDMVYKFGMGNNNIIGNIICSNVGSTKIKDKLSNDVINIINLCHNNVKNILIKNWKNVELIAKNLIKIKEIDYKTFCEIIIKNIK